MAKDILVETYIECVMSDSRKKEAFLAGVQSGLNVANLYISAGLLGCSFASAFLKTNIEAIENGTKDFPYGRATDRVAVILALSVPYEQMIPDRYFVRTQFLTAGNDTKRSYLRGVLLAMETLFEVKGEFDKKLGGDISEALNDYLTRMNESIRSIPS